MNTLPHPDQHPTVACGAGHCGRCLPGHDLHIIPARKAGESPWGWRDAVVTRVTGLEVTVDYVAEVGQPVLWHHRSFATHVEVGDPVRLHERYGVLATPDGWFSVAVREGLGPIPRPDLPGLWAAEIVAVVVDLSTGMGIPIDRA